MRSLGSKAVYVKFKEVEFFSEVEVRIFTFCEVKTKAAGAPGRGTNTGGSLKELEKEACQR